ncbi:unnamed protein product [Calypogeia fissa]
METFASSSCSNTTGSYSSMAWSSGMALLCSPRPLGIPLLPRQGGVKVLRAGRVVGRRGGEGEGGTNWPSCTKEKAAAGLKGVECARGRNFEGGRVVGHGAFHKRFSGLQFGSIASVVRRKNELAQDEPQRKNNLDYNKGLWWELFGKDIVTGHGGECQIGGEERLPLRDLSSKFIQLSVMCSLCLGSPWFSPFSAMASAEPLDANGRAQVWQQNFSNVLGFKGFEGEAAVQLSHERSLAAPPLSEPQLRNSQPGVLFSLAESSKVCEESYGFLPCSDSLGGNLSLIVAYGNLLLVAAQLISKGSELLLEVMNAGLLGGLLLPILGALPDALLILVSGLGGTAQEAQEQVMVGVGVLAGSIVMLLTIGWVGSLYAGRCDLSGPGGTAEDRKLTRPLDWAGTGVTTDEQTRVGAWIMVLSALPFVVVQIPLLDGHPSEGPEAALTGSIVSFVSVLAYSFYQVSFPWLQQKRIEEARLQFLRSRALQSVTAFSGKRGGWSPRLLQENKFGPSPELLRELFISFDSNKDGKIQKEELRGLLVGLELEEEGSIPDKTQIDLWLQEFDVDLDGTLSMHEFMTGIGKWAQKISKEKWSRKIQQLESKEPTADDPRFWAAQSSEARKVLELLESEAGGEEEDEENDSEVVDAGSIKRTAALYLAGGAALAALFADPLVDSIGGFSKASTIPPFFVAFVVTPFASNASELVSSFFFAKGRRKKNISLTFSQLYGGVTMNNTLCLGLFLALVYVRNLTWEFSSEVTVILLSVVALGAIGGSRTTFPVSLGLPVLAIYPMCISLVAILDNVLGWK